MEGLPVITECIAVRGAPGVAAPIPESGAMEFAPTSLERAPGRAAGRVTDVDDLLRTRIRWPTRPAPEVG